MKKLATLVATLALSTSVFAADEVLQNIPGGAPTAGEATMASATGTGTLPQQQMTTTGPQNPAMVDQTTTKPKKHKKHLAKKATAKPADAQQVATAPATQPTAVEQAPQQ